MGKAKTQRTDDLRQAARRFTVAKQAQQAIEQHNLDRLVRNGVLVRVKYIQDTDWWKKGEKAFAEHIQKGMDKVIVEAFGCKGKSMLNSKAGGVGEGRASKCL